MKRRKRFLIVILTFFMAVSSLSQTRNGKFVFQNETILTGYSAHIFMEIDLVDARAAATVLLQELINNWAFNLISQVDFYEELDALKKDIRDSKVDFVVVTTPEYLLLRNQVNITPFITYNVGGQILHRMLLVSRIDSDIRSVLELKKRRIAVYSALNDEFNLPSLWLTTLVLKNGGNYDNGYASSVYKVRKGPNAISDVFFRKADAAVVPDRDFIISKELNPQIAAQLSVIDSSNSLLYALMCYTEKLTTSLARYKDCDMQVVTDMLCNADKSENGKQLLSIFRINSFVPLKNEYLTDTEALFNDFIMLSRSKNRQIK